MTELLEEKRHDEVLAPVDPEALIAEARRRQRNRRVVIAVVVAVAGGAGLGAYFALMHSNMPSTAGGNVAVFGKPSTVRLHLRGFGTPLPTQLDQGPCPQGRTLVRIAPTGSVIECVLAISKLDAPHYGIKQISQTTRETYHLSGGTIVTLERQTVYFARNQHHTTKVITGRVVGGTGRYAHARGTVSGGGAGVGDHANWLVSLRVR